VTLKSEEDLEIPTEPGIPLKRLPISVTGDSRRVITRPFLMNAHRVSTLLERLDGLDESAVEEELREVYASYEQRHDDLPERFLEHFQTGARLVKFDKPWSGKRQLLGGAYMTMEYAIDAAALFNPSIVAHPDQTGAAPGAVRILMSLRATGEGHVSSLVFRTGTIDGGGELTLDPPPRRFYTARIAPDRQYNKSLYRQKLAEMVIAGEVVDQVLSEVPDLFTLPQIAEVVTRHLFEAAPAGERDLALRTILSIAQSNYHVDIDVKAPLSELVIFPLSTDESHGIEDVRLTRFVADDGKVTYYGTYTAYNGARVLPMLMSTTNFRRFEFHSLNGSGAANKGMALFPRKIGGRFVMCTRIDGENLFISTSDAVHFWNDPQLLVKPKFPWELMQIGNCGAPIETPEGWILLTHGVGPVRTYAIGAMLLDLQDPLKIRGHLREPLIVPEGEEREGYVPNVVYTCGAMLHGKNLYIPYAKADHSASVAVVPVAALLKRLLS